MALLLLAVLAVLGLCLCVFLVARNFATTPLAAARLVLAWHDVPVTNSTELLMRRYLERSRHFRSGWTWTAVFAALALGIGWNNPANPTSPLGSPVTTNLLVMALGGWFVGLVRTDTYNLRRHWRGPRTVSLEPRSLRNYLPRWLSVNLVAFAVLGVLAVPACTWLPGYDENLGEVIALALLVVLVAAVGDASTRAIARRPRPAVSEDLRRADDALRSLASLSVAYGAGGLEALLVSVQLSAIGAIPVDVIVNGHLASQSGARQYVGLLAIPCFIWALTQAWRARRQVRPSARPRGSAA